MMRAKLTGAVLLACLLLGLSACGNKGPLVLPEAPEEEEQQKTEPAVE